ncbi:DNA polymerase III subunit epsilon OS=Streptomyces griseorubiginosus OX=67304 GN=AQJ54_40020 PE=4 SV=1 [Streptomyces griseorubiginosus]
MLSPDLTPSLGHLFTRTIDTKTICFVRPGDTRPPTWALYEDARYLGTVHAQFDSGRNWLRHSREQHHPHLDDAVRALRRPAWRTEHERVRRWVPASSPTHLVVLDVQTTALAEQWAVIGVTDRHGTVLWTDTSTRSPTSPPRRPHCTASPASRSQTRHPSPRLHITSASSCTTAAALIYNAAFDHGVLERELRRYFRGPAHARAWLGQCTWVDANRLRGRGGRRPNRAVRSPLAEAWPCHQRAPRDAGAHAGQEWHS